MTRIPYLEGRPLTESDGEHRGVAVSQSFALKYWPERTAVGQRFRHSRADDSGPWFHIVGVVGDVGGILAGLAAGLALKRFMRRMVHGVNVTEPSVYVAVALILAGVSLVAAWLPARRASRVDPMLALRSE